MPNTKSAERRMRGSVRKQARNKAIKTRLKSLERNYLEVVEKGDKTAAQGALRSVISAMDKAAKTGVVPQGRVDRKKSRLAVRLKP